jgi:hypothetical protein
MKTAEEYEKTILSMSKEWQNRMDWYERNDASCSEEKRVLIKQKERAYEELFVHMQREVRLEMEIESLRTDNEALSRNLAALREKNEK